MMKTAVSQPDERPHAFAAEERGGPTLIQPLLPSEQLPHGWLWEGLRGRDLLVLCLFSVLLVTNVPIIAGAGGASFVYWGLGFLTFLIPSALVCAQLYRLFPGEGAVYVWANKAFGNFWDTFLGFFCNWWPGCIGLTVEALACVTSIQALNANWLQASWQQGVAGIVVLVLAQGLCCMGQRRLQRILNSVFLVYLGFFLLLGCAGVIFVLTGHQPQGNFSSQGWLPGPTTYPLFATVIISLLGMAVPLNLGAEVRDRCEASQYLLWGTGITIGVYLLGTLAVSAVLPPGDLSDPAFLTDLFSTVWGPLGTALGVINYVVLIGYFICAAAAYNSLFARLLWMAGVDQRLPAMLGRLRAGVPFHATVVQTLINVFFIGIVFLIAPWLVPSVAQFSFAVFLVTISGAALIWNLAMIGLFLCGIILVRRSQHNWHGGWVLPPVLFYAVCVLGMGAAAIAIVSTLVAGSPLPSVLSNTDWIYWVLIVTLASLAVGAIVSFLAPEAEDLSAFFARQIQHVQPSEAQQARAATLVAPGGSSFSGQQMAGLPPVPPLSARSGSLPNDVPRGRHSDTGSGPLGVPWP
ncbi:MAG: APC family permease [Ktedonobacteraceae bacterium]